MFVTDAELIRELHLPEKAGKRALAALDAGIPNMRRFPQPDPRFGNRRFLPAVLQWLYDYYGVKPPPEGGPPSIQSTWSEHFDDEQDAETGETGRT
jgi:hypothetical protein